MYTKTIVVLYDRSSLTTERDHHEKVKVGNDQEMAQSENYSPLKTPDGKN